MVSVDVVIHECLISTPNMITFKSEDQSIKINNFDTEVLNKRPLEFKYVYEIICVDALYLSDTLNKN